MLATAIKNIAALQPSPLPDVQLPRVPDISAAQPLADIAHGDASQLIAAANLLTGDNETISAVLNQARGLVTAAAGDIFGIGTRLIQAAAPIAMGLISLDPASRAAALASLRTVIDEHIGLAMARVNRLKDELTTTAAALLPISQRPVESAVGQPQQAMAAAATHTAVAPPAELAAAPTPKPDRAQAGRPLPRPRANWANLIPGAEQATAALTARGLHNGPIPRQGWIFRARRTSRPSASRSAQINSSPVIWWSGMDMWRCIPAMARSWRPVTPCRPTRCGRIIWACNLRAFGGRLPDKRPPIPCGSWGVG